MGLRSSMGSGRYAVGEKDVYVADPQLAGVRGVIWCHGATTDATSCRDYSYIGRLHLTNALAERFPLLSIDAGGPQAWGNPTAVARVDDAVTYLQGTKGAKSGTVLLVGVSMGALTALNYAKANPSKVAAIVGIIPVIDLNDMVTNDRGPGSAALINTAYGTYSEATHGPAYNPATYAASFTTPTRLFYASDDMTCIPAAVTAFDTACAAAAATSLGALGHTEAAIDAAPRDVILAFLAQHA